MKKLVKIYLREKTILDALFDDGFVKRYDVLDLSKTYPQLKQLANRSLFLKGKILGTSGVKWNDELDIDAQTIYSDGKTIKIKENIESVLLGFNLKMERLKNKLSQEEVSKITGIEQADISKIENGCANPTFNTIVKLVNCYSKTISFTMKNI